MVEESNDDAAQQEQQATLAERLNKASSATGTEWPWGGALIRVDRTLYEPSRLTISSFSIKPYDGQLIAGQMLQADILLPRDGEPFTVSVAGAVKTLDDDFGLRAIFSSPQPYAQVELAQHLIALRKQEEEAARTVAKAKKKRWGL